MSNEYIRHSFSERRSIWNKIVFTQCVNFRVKILILRKLHILIKAYLKIYKNLNYCSVVIVVRYLTKLYNYPKSKLLNQ